MAEFSISKTARLLKVHRATVHRWIAKGLVPEPVAKEIAGSKIRYWTDEGFARVKEYKEKHFGKKPREANKGVRKNN
jgi:DNA-binding transcriptional MerR regulator